MPASAFRSVLHPAPKRRRFGMLRQIAAVFGAPTVWAGQMIVSEILSSYACYPYQAPLSAPLWNWLPWGLGIVSGLTIVAAAFFLSIAWGSWRRSRNIVADETKKSPQISGGRTRFMALIGLYSSGLFLTAAIFTTIAFLIVSPCQKWL